MTIIPVLSKQPNLVNELVKILPIITFHVVQDPATDPHFNTSAIIICDFDLFGPYMYNLPNVKWVSGTWAGIDKLMPFVQKDRKVPYNITRFTGEAFGKIMSEYVVANIVNYERDFYNLRDHLKKGEWFREGKVTNYRIISDMTIGILGLGTIGNKIGKTLNDLGGRILAFGRRASLPVEEEYKYVAEYHTRETLHLLLKKSDYLINVLPKTVETTGLLEGDILKHCSERKTIFINVGRSNIISEEGLIKAITNQWIAAAMLDVFDKEPLPENNPLWKMDKVFITPHVAGVSRAKDIAESFKKNYEKFINKTALNNVIDLSRGY